MARTDDDLQQRRPASPGRVPPHDIQAEESLLGAMMLDPEAIANVAGKVRTDDFYKPAHAHIFDAVHALYAAGQPVDPVTVADELRRAGMLEMVGGHQTLVQVMASTPATSNVGGYAKIIEEHALLRRMIGVAGEISEIGFSLPDDVTKAMDRAESLVYEVAQRRVTDSTSKIEELLGHNLDRLEQLYSRGDAITGVPSGYVDLDELLSGLQPNALVVVGARPAMGKALALDTPVPTPTGWTTMGEIQVGDQVLDDQGQPCTVTYATPTQHNRTCYAVTFDDGTTLTADADHQWLAGDGHGPRVVTTQQMVDAGVTSGERPRWSTPVSPQLERCKARRLGGGSGTSTLQRITHHAVVAIERVASVGVRCITVDSANHLYLAGRTMIPTHNTSFALGMASHAAVAANHPVLVFSLEMGNLELSQRMLCSEARIDSQRVKTGKLNEDDWNRISGAIGRLAAAPIWIDDNPNTTVMEIRAKARRLKSQVGSLGMVVVDYLQLMTGRSGAESRQVEVSEISRGLKILARELECPVIALSQLSRQLEQRADKRPMLADLRESGCLTADARVLRADTGAEVTIGELAALGERDIPVWSLDTDMRMVPATMTHAFATGVKEVFELHLASGRTVKASANHPFLTVDGWKRLDELTVGSRIAVPRVVPEPKEAQEWPEPELVMLAHLIGDGCVASRQPIHYTSADPACVDAVVETARHFGIEPRLTRQKNWTHVYLPAPFKLARGRRNPIAAWLDQWDLYGKRSHEKFIPDPVLALSDDQVALFLGHLWATDGCVGWWGQGRIYYASTSRRLASGVQALLLRLGIQSTLRPSNNAKGRPGYQLHVRGQVDQLRFLDHIAVIGERSAGAAELRRRLTEIRFSTSNHDHVPVEVWGRVRDLMEQRGVTRRDLQSGLGAKYRSAQVYKRGLSRDDLRQLAEYLDDWVLGALATSDATWDSVLGMESLGEEPVFDATVNETHNFMANGIVVSNSIEQDADVVMFIYRDDVYHSDSPDRGQAEIIVAKHRNGPTGVVRLAFLDQFTRFANMARVD